MSSDFCFARFCLVAAFATCACQFLHRSANTKTMLPEILKLFDLADADGSGEIAIEERSDDL